MLVVGEVERRQANVEVVVDVGIILEDDRQIVVVLPAEIQIGRIVAEQAVLVQVWDRHRLVLDQAACRVVDDRCLEVGKSIVVWLVEREFHLVFAVRRAVDEALRLQVLVVQQHLHRVVAGAERAVEPARIQLETFGVSAERTDAAGEV